MSAYDNTCAVCFKPATQTCAQCKSIKYCGLKCQKEIWSDHKLICKQRSEMPPRPSDNHFLALFFPADQPHPRLLWTRGQPTVSKLHLHEADVSKLVGEDFDCVEAGTGPGSTGTTVQVNEPTLAGKHPLMPPLGIHYTTKPYYQKNKSLGRWVGEQYLSRIAPRPLLVVGANGVDAGDGHRDFEMRDLRTLKSVLTTDVAEEYMDLMIHRAGSARMKKAWLRK
ncbi:hypothetical protein LTR95_014465 [Oleoguttula sp. CCFEE 5521]